MVEQLTIDRDNKPAKAQDYSFLRKEGISLIERLSGKVWTDYNTHDPGITLLEAICYALTDLGYRTSYDVKDILTTTSDASADTWKKVFYTARQILPCSPLTIIDYRKLIIDTEGVRNAWIEPSDEYEVLIYLQNKQSNPNTEQSYALTYDYKNADDVLHLRGLYKVFVEYEDDIVEDHRSDEVAEIIWKKLRNHRNLTEDFVSVSSVEYEYFPIEADIQVSEGTDIEMINAKIYKVIHDFFSPPVNFYSLEQMLEKKSSAEEVFEGPILGYGFIDTDELIKSERFMHIHLSDIINLISGIEGVIAVKKFTFGIETQSPFSNFTEWVNNAKDKQKIPRLDTDNSAITFLRSGDRHRTDNEKHVDKERVNAIFKFLKSDNFKTRLKGAGRDLPVPVGEFMDIADYYPFQKNLPITYGMTDNMIDNNDKVDRQAISNALTELLNEKAGTKGTRLIYTLLQDPNIKDKTPIKKTIKHLLDSAERDISVVAILIDEIFNYDDQEDKRLRKIVDDLYGKKEKSPGKKHLHSFIKEEDSDYPYPSGKTLLLKQLAKELNLSIDEIDSKGEIAKLNSAYQKNKINALDRRRKLVLQLRGFLMVFEQILADYLSQLAHTKDIFSFDETIEKTFYPQITEEIEDMEVLFIDFKHYRDSHLRMLETKENFYAKRNQVLDHIVSRFSESMDRYSFFMQQFSGKGSKERLINDKISFLSDYIEISSYRGRGYNYLEPDQNWESDNVEGIKKRICRLLGIKNYRRQKIAPTNIFIEKIFLDNDVERFVVKLTDPQHKNFVLLQSKEPISKSEAVETLTYILEEGHNRELFKEEGHGNKWHFVLRRISTNNEPDPFASSLIFETREERDAVLTKTIDTLEKISSEENFHILEHILLRPKIGSRDSHGDEVKLLPTEYVPKEIHSKHSQQQEMAYKFKITHLKDENKKNRNLWKLSLMKDDNELLSVEEDFIFYKHLTRRIELIREFAADRANYEQGNTVDGYLTFRIKGAKGHLAISKKNFRKQEDFDEEIENLINFFSHELGLMTSAANENTPAFYADPYSFQISVFIPAWQERFRNSTFKHLIEKTIYLETPSHVYPHVYWLDQNEMREFDEAYEVWSKEIATNEIPATDIVNNMVSVLNKLTK